MIRRYLIGLKQNASCSKFVIEKGQVTQKRYNPVLNGTVTYVITYDN